MFAEFYKNFSLSLLLFTYVSFAKAAGISEGGPTNCPQQFYSAFSGYILSPGFPKNYENQEDCHYYIMAPDGYHVEIVFYEFRTEPCCDKLHIYKGPNVNTMDTIADLQGEMSQIVGHRYDSGMENSMTLWFETDYSITSSGFYARYTLVPNFIDQHHSGSTQTPASCPGDSYQMTYGLITSPNWPNEYPNGMSCHYQLTVEKGKQVNLTFNEFDTEPCCDFVMIYDGHDVNEDAMIQKLYGLYNDSSMLSYKSTGNKMLVVFSSDVSVCNKGFSATFTTDPLT